MINYYIDLKRMDYEKCLRLQYHLVELRKNDKIPNTALFVEHNSIYTIGRKADPKNYENVNVYKTDRGGDVTYHGPGQIVNYFIFDVNIDGRREIRRFLENIENAYIKMLGSFGYSAMLDEEPGIWIETEKGKKKVASIGLAVKDNISYHGIALNIGQEAVNGFNLINPCGLDNSVMSYVDIPRDKAIEAIVSSLADYFGEFQKINIDDIKLL
ncbi:MULTISPECIES: lipoyl(octanoyl) transferase LipB [Acidiplasma]|jgi:lipoyl(octanoyl) transferase|nr:MULTISPECIES: lipoyl(octanoyl) transferase LipB [Acidiplasma]